MGDATIMIIWLGLTAAPLTEEPPVGKEDLITEESTNSPREPELPSSLRDPPLLAPRSPLR